MRRTFAILALVFAIALSVTAQNKPAETKKKSGDPAVEQKLTQMEKDLWEAWKTQNLEPFKKAMADESMSVGSTGVADTKAALGAVTSGACKVTSYAVDQPQFMWIDKNSVMMAYHASQDATCDGKKVPPEVWASSVWVKHGNEWKAVFHQETPAAAKKTE